MRAFNIILVPWFLRQCPFSALVGMRRIDCLIGAVPRTFAWKHLAFFGVPSLSALPFEPDPSPRVELCLSLLPLAFGTSAWTNLVWSNQTNDFTSVCSKLTRSIDSSAGLTASSAFGTSGLGTYAFGIPLSIQLCSLLWDLFHLQFGILGLGAFSFELALDWN